MPRQRSSGPTRRRSLPLGVTTPRRPQSSRTHNPAPTPATDDRPCPPAAPNHTLLPRSDDPCNARSTPCGELRPTPTRTTTLEPRHGLPPTRFRFRQTLSGTRPNPTSVPTPHAPPRTARCRHRRLPGPATLPRSPTPAPSLLSAGPLAPRRPTPGVGQPHTLPRRQRCGQHPPRSRSLLRSRGCCRRRRHRSLSPPTQHGRRLTSWPCDCGLSAGPVRALTGSNPLVP